MLKIKRILITGAHSFIGTSFENWISLNKPEYSIETISVENDDWKCIDFNQYYVILHVAAIVHKKEEPDMEQLYMKVNYELPVAVAEKAKSQGVKQFIFISTMNVYGVKSGIININRKPSPKSFYGISKLKAEYGLAKLQSETFKLAVLRPPMVYGSGCKGNYAALSKLVSKTLIFPDYYNQRSMISINNLCEVIESLISENESGIFCPQDPEYVCTSEMVRSIAESKNKKIYYTKLFNPIIKLVIPHIEIINKVFGDLMYKNEQLN